MTTLSASATLAIGESTPAEASVGITVLPLAGPGEGTGRLIHPTLGTIDYQFAPDRWRGHIGDAVVFPIWSVSQTLAGALVALWDGTLEDVVVEEAWEGEIVMRRDELDALLAFYQSPPDPALGVPSGYVQWWPSYESDLGFYVCILAVSAGSSGGIELTNIPADADGDEWVEGSVSIRMQLVARVE
jgi:hypothetical protein